MKKGWICIVLAFALAETLSAEPSTKIMARTRSGSRVELAEVSSTATSLRLGPATEELDISDPIVALEGLDGLRYLESLTIVLLPQIADFNFLTSVPSVVDLTISHCRLDDLSFLSSLPALSHLRIEMCRNRERGSILSSGALDLASVPDLESIVLLDCGLESLPRLYTPPKRLSFVDLSWNPFRLDESSRADLEGYRAVETLVVAGIEVAPAIRDAFPNIPPSENE